MPDACALRGVVDVIAMKARVDAGTDVAMIGAWDAQRGAQPFTAEEFKQLSDTLDADATQGHVFVLHTGADGGGPVDVYVDEPIPAEVMARLTPLGWGVRPGTSVRSTRRRRRGVLPLEKARRWPGGSRGERAGG